MLLFGKPTPTGELMTITVFDDDAEIKAAIDKGFYRIEGTIESKVFAAAGQIVIDTPEFRDGKLYRRKQAVTDTRALTSQIESLRQELASEDYKVIKNMEAFVAGEELPYDHVTLRKNRDRKRARINELESKLL